MIRTLATLCVVATALESALREETVQLAVSAAGRLDVHREIKGASEQEELQSKRATVQVDPVVNMACADSLIGQSTIGASSSQPDKGPIKSVIDDDLTHAWEPVASTKEEWIDWTWDTPREVHLIQTSGLTDRVNDGSVTTYKIQYGSSDTGEWVFYQSAKDKDAGSPWTIIKSTGDAGAPSLYEFDPPIRSNHVRLWPQEWQTKVALRASILGCETSSVQAGNLDLNARYGDIIPSKYEGANILGTELRARLAESMGCEVDQVKVVSIVPNPENAETIRCEIHVLPKAAHESPSDLMNKMAAAINDETSSLFNWMKNIESEPQTHATCLGVQCGNHGQCAGGKCFCFDKYTGDTCDTLNGVRDFSAVKAATQGDAQTTASGGILQPLPVLANQPLLTFVKYDKNKSKPSEEDLEAAIQNAGTETRDRHSDEEEGVSGLTHRHKIVFVAPLIFGLAILSAAAAYTQTKKGSKNDDLLDDDDEDLPTVH